MKKRIVPALFIAGFCCLVLNADGFSFIRMVDAIAPKDNGTAAGDMAWGDLNMDGKADLVAVGTHEKGSATLLYLYTNLGHRPIYDHGLPALGAGSKVAIGDIDGDGINDVVMFGKKGTTSGSAIFKAFINNGKALFAEGQDLGALLPTENPETGLAGAPGSDPTERGLYEVDGLSAGVLELRDLNRDGSLDILFSGVRGEANVQDKDGRKFTRYASCSGVFINDGKGKFTLLAREGRGPDSGDAGFYKASRAASAMADLNGDGVLDLVLIGEAATGASRTTKKGATLREGLPFGEVYLGVGDGSFKRVKGAGIPALINGSIVAADFNRDGKKDLAIVGSTGKASDPDGGRYVGVFLGKGDGTFSLDKAQKYGSKNPDGLQPVMNGAVAAGDMDLDGSVDLAIAGDGGARSLRFYKNAGGVFRLQELDKIKDGVDSTKKSGALSTDAMTECDLSLVDMDGDGDLDIFLNGKAASIALEVFRNKAR